MQQPEAQTFLSNLYTTEEVRLSLSLLRDFLEQFFFVEYGKGPQKAALIDFLTNKNHPEYVKEAFTRLDDTFFDSFTKDNTNETLESLKKEIQNKPVLTLYTPVKLANEHSVPIGKWVRQNVAPLALLDIQVDSLVVGGCAIVWKGVYYDFSLEYFIEKKKQDIIGMIRSYYHEGRKS